LAKASAIFKRETLIAGRPTLVECVTVGEQCFRVQRGPVVTVSLFDEWYEDLATDPGAVVQALRACRGLNADLFTFWQRLPDVKPKYDHHVELEDLAVLPVSTYDHWWNQQIKSRVRNQIRRSGKDGLEVRETAYDDDFVRGMMTIFNESPIRQGRPFWHFGKDFETVREQFSRYVHRERMIGAYVDGNMVGFVMLGHAGRYAITGQVLSSLHARDRHPNNALIAKAVELCALAGLPHLVYFSWSDDSLAEFKRRCGFEKVTVPRYYLPMSAKGSLALRLGLHRGLRRSLPEPVRATLKRWRSAWYRKAAP
jgi:hypothetical protein